MQSMPLLLRQSFKSSLNITRTTRPVRRPLLPAVGPKALYPAPRNFSICLQCQFRTQSSLYSSDPLKDGKAHEQPKEDAFPTPTAVPPEGKQSLEADAGSQAIPLPPPPSPPVTETGESTPSQPREEKREASTEGKTESGGLPSYLENRRSQFSKQFSDMMDNLQSNIFVAGQRLNDLTGYSAIEALKREIHTQGMRI